MCIIYVYFFFLENVDIVTDNKADKIHGRTLLKDMMYTQLDWEKEIGLVG